MGVTIKAREKAIRKLKKTPFRTREELEYLLDPPTDIELNDIHAKGYLTKTKKSSTVFKCGLLGYEYPIHVIYFRYMFQSSRERKTPLPIEYEHTGKDLLEFILEVGLPDKNYKDPIIQLTNKKLGYVSGNFHWKDKVKKTSVKVDKVKKDSNRKFVVFKDRKYYKTKIQGNIEYVWDSKRAKEKTTPADGYVKRFLRSDIWEAFHTSYSTNRTIEVIDPDGDPFDPLNLRLKATISTHPSHDRMWAFRQSTADILAGYVKVCLGCSAQWRILEDKVWWVRKPAEIKYGPCESHHLVAKEKSEWASATDIMRAGLELPHAQVTAGLDDASFLNRGNSKK